MLTNQSSILSVRSSITLKSFFNPGLLASTAGIFSVLSSLTLSAMVAAADSSIATLRPNILILLTDDQRWDAIGVNNPALKIATPNIDRLAARGVNFSQAFVTTPICAVSRACILSGRYSRNARIHEFLIPFDQDIWRTSYPALLKGAGYFLGQLGKYGVGATKEQRELFDLFDADLAQGKPFHSYQGKMVHDSEWLTRRAQDFFDQVPTGRPFVLQVNYKAPHPSSVPAPEDLGKLKGEEFPAMGSDTPAMRALLPAHVLRGLGGGSYTGDFGTPERRNKWIGTYLEKIISVDRSVGAIMADLEQRGLAENTVVFFLSDHGTHFGEHGLSAKWSPYDPSLRIPLIVADLRRKQTVGTTNSALVLNLDMAPTVLDLARLPTEPGMDGRSLLPLLRGEKPADWRRHFFFEHQMSLATIPRPIPRNMGVRTESEKYLVWTDRSPGIEEYYVLSDDPEEMKNHVAERPEAVATLRSLFQQWEKENPNTYDYMPYGIRPQTGSPNLDWEKFKAAKPKAYERIAVEIKKRGLSWDDALEDPEARWEIGMAAGYLY
jgi:arylsulfatase A-like enzyme